MKMQCTRDINQQYILDPACPDDDLWSPKTVAETDGMSRVMLESALLASKCTVEFQRSVAKLLPSFLKKRSNDHIL